MAEEKGPGSDTMGQADKRERIMSAGGSSRRLPSMRSVLGGGSQIQIERQSTVHSLHSVPDAGQTTCSRNWACFWWLGTLNNLPYVIIMSAAKKIADDNDEKHLMPLLTWGLNAVGFLMRIFNTVCLAGKPYGPRFMGQAIGTASGLVIVGCASWIGDSGGTHFAMAVLGTIVLGTASAFGESTALGFMYKFPRGMVGGWSSGTGMAGVLGSGLTLGLFSAGLSTSTIMFTSTGWVLIYLFAYYMIEIPGEEDEPVLEAHEVEECVPVDEEGDGKVAKVDWAHIKEVHGKCFSNILQMALVYVFEYAIQSAAAYVQPCETNGVKTEDSSNFIVKNFYVISQIMYQSGVFLSRSSLECFQIKRVGLLSLAQFFNMVWWLLLAKTKWLGGTPGVYWMLPMMFVVGLFGGASYVNVFHLVQTDKELTGLEKELAMNIGGLYVNLGIIGGALITLIFANTLLAGEACDDGSSASGSGLLSPALIAPALMMAPRGLF
eukprot:Hpha_TRINITY_DN11559_c0_g1::TRINITY_DN11559_c0_g1_i1::g.32180::m.32180/K12389/BTS, CLN3; battenin